MHSISYIAHSTITSGPSLWILRAALENPDCVIIVKDKTKCKQRMETFEHLYNKSPWYKKIIWKFRKIKRPEFVSVEYLKQDISFLKTYPADKPIIFDWSALIED